MHTQDNLNFQVYWKPKLTIKRSTGSFRVRVSDLVKYNRDSDLQVMPDSKILLIKRDVYLYLEYFIQISTLLDSKRIHHRDAELDEDWYEFDVTGAVSRWIRTKPKKTRYGFV